MFSERVLNILKCFTVYVREILVFYFIIKINYFIKLLLKFKILLNVHRCGVGGSMRVCHAVVPGSIPGRDTFCICIFEVLERVNISGH